MMFLHIGNSRVVHLQDVVGIFNLEIKDKQVNTQFLECNAGDQLSAKDDEKNNSFVITTDKVFYSPISSLTLQKRVEKMRKL